MHVFGLVHKCISRVAVRVSHNGIRMALDVFSLVLHGESNTGQALPRTPTQRTFQPQDAVQP